MSKGYTFGRDAVRNTVFGHKNQFRKPILIPVEAELYKTSVKEVIFIDGRKRYVAKPRLYPGLFLFVKEPYSIVPKYPMLSIKDPRFHEVQTIYRYDLQKKKDEMLFKWIPSPSMKEGYSRLFIVIDGVSVTRLHKISMPEIHAEGWDTPVDFAKGWNREAPLGYKWDDNPWVWKVRFTKVKGVANPGTKKHAYSREFRQNMINKFAVPNDWLPEKK